MRATILCGLALALTLPAATGRADELLWRPASGAAPAAGPTTPPPRPPATATSPAGHGALTVGRPEPLASPAAGDGGLRPVAFTAPAADTGFLARGNAQDELRTPLPAGPALGGPPAAPPGGYEAPMPRVVPSAPPVISADPGMPAPPPAARVVPFHPAAPLAGVPLGSVPGADTPYPAGPVGVHPPGVVVEGGPVGPVGVPVGDGVLQPDWGCCEGGCPAVVCCDPVCCDPCCAAGCGSCCQNCPDGCCWYPGWLGHKCCQCLFGGCNPCCRLPRFYGNVEYLYWGVNDADVPPLVTTSTNLLMSTGVLGQPGTVVAFGGDNINGHNGSGLRFTFGVGRQNSCWGLEGTFLFLPQVSDDFFAFSPGNYTLARPIVDARTGQEAVQKIGTPFVFADGTVLPETAGTARVDNPFRAWGAEANLRKAWLCGCRNKLDFLMGFRFLEVQDALTVQENVQILLPSPGLPTGTDFLVTDMFDARNRFYGGQVGLDYEYRFLKHWYLGVLGKIALGSMDQVVNINGSTIITTPGQPRMAFNEGVLALSTNSGEHRRQVFSVIPELGVKLGCQLTEHVSVYAGYTFLAVTNVARSAEQVDRTTNPNLFPNGAGGGPSRPVFLFQDSTLVIHAFNAGVDFRW